jgi:hypothetical protein
MKNFNKLFIITIMLAIVFIPRNAYADLIYSLTSTAGPAPSGFGSSPYGSIDISSVNSNEVAITVVLNNSIPSGQNVYHNDSILLNLASGAPAASTLTLLNPPSGSGQGISASTQNTFGGNQFDFGVNLVGNSLSAPTTFSFDLSTSSILGLTPQDFFAKNPGSTYYAAIEMVIESTDVGPDPTNVNYIIGSTQTIGLPEPSTYLTLGSLLGFAFAYRLRKNKAITSTKVA